MGRGSTVLGILGIILAAGAIGFGFFVWNGQNTTNSGLNSDLDYLTDVLNNITNEFNNLTDYFNNLPKTLVVGKWDSFNVNFDYSPHNTTKDWLFEFGGNYVSNTDYILVSNNNTRITLLKSGWHRIQLSLLLGGISPNILYKTMILKDGPIEFVLDRFQTGATVDSIWHPIDSSVVV